MNSNSLVRAVLSTALALGGALVAGDALAQDVVVGSVDLATGQATLLTDRFKTEFPDGGPILRLVAKARADNMANGFVLVRAGRLKSGACHTEVIGLTQVADQLVLSATPVFRFSCEEVEERCDTDGGYPAICMPDDTNTVCQCRPGFAAGPGTSPRCEKVLTLPWPLTIDDIVWRFLD